MFLTELCRFYERKIDEPDSGVALPGYSEENISYVIRLSPEGRYLHHMPLSNDKGKPRRMKVPAAVKRSVQVLPNLLWDNSSYVLGASGKTDKKRDSQVTFNAFRQKHHQLANETGNPALKAVASFLNQWTPETLESWMDKEALLDKNIVFEIEGQNGFVHEQPDVQVLLEGLRNQENGQSSGEKGFCLITGQMKTLARIHPAIRGLKGGKAETALVSFNCDAFESYGKSQSYNAPVSVESAQAYTTALNWLLRAENGHSVGIGDTTVVYWTDKPAMKEETITFHFLSPPAQFDSEKQPAEDKSLLLDVQGLLRALRDGLTLEAANPDLNPDVDFFLLGLAPNSARIAVRFWQKTSFGELARRVGRYYAELKIERAFPDTQPEFPAFWQILLETAVQGKRENIPPLLGGALMRSVFSGMPYPASLYTAVLSRIRADKKVTYLRAAVIKACLTRNHQMEFAMSLDTERQDVPYLLGRLFSLLEKNQRDALGNEVNSTVRDRYIGSASATPRRVFPLLIRLTQHHISKSGYEIPKQREIADVMSNVPAFPASLTLEEQGTFFLGYYHQSNANYTKKDKD